VEEQEIAAAIGWMLAASSALAITFSSVFSRHGYRATTAGLILVCLGRFIAGHTWAAVVALCLTLARYGYYLYVRFKK
jgi:hypothetical protein